MMSIAITICISRNDSIFLLLQWIYLLILSIIAIVVVILLKQCRCSICYRAISADNSITSIIIVVIIDATFSNGNIWIISLSTLHLDQFIVVEWISTVLLLLLLLRIVLIYITSRKILDIFIKEWYYICVI